jgi:hypothetical protein
MLFGQEVRNCAGSTVSLGLWSAKGQRTREMHVSVPQDTASLGLSLQWTALAVASNIWHVLDVPANSPADTAGLLPYSDYVLGTPEGVLHGESGLSELVEDHIGRPLRLYVYNNEYNVTREVTIQPSRDWGGEGALGCVLGYGALHRLPAPLSEPVSAPGETMFDGAAPGRRSSQFDEKAALMEQEQAQLGIGEGFVPANSSELVVPAQLANTTAPPPPSAAGPPRGKKSRHGHGATPNAMMDDYFKEQETKSRELDNAPSGRGTPAPPPPKAGGPPKTSAKADEAAATEAG